MTVEFVYYMFSLATFLFAIIHVCNMVFYKRHNKTLFGMTFKKGSVEHERMRKAASQQYKWISIAAIPLLFINLVLAIQDILRTYNRKTAILFLVTYTLLVLAILIGTLVKLRDYLGGGAIDKPKHRNNEDDEW